MKKNKKNQVVDENGESVVTEKKKVDWKSIGKKALVGLGVVAGGVIAFFAVGVAMSLASDAEEETTIDSGDGTITFTPNEGTDTIVEQNGGTEE